MPGNVKEILNFKELNTFLKTDKNSFKILFFKEDYEKETEVFIKSFSTSYKGIISFAEIDGDNSKIKKKYNVNRVPSMVILKKIDEEWDF